MAPEEKPTILIVEDDEPTQRMLQAILRRSAFASETTSNGAGAIERLREKRYAAVILDMMMPEVGGIDVIEFLRGAAEVPPVIVCSAAGPRALANLDRTIVRAVVRKPFDIEELLTALAGVTGAGS